MDSYTNITGKREIRNYSDRPIPNESLDRILQAGRMSGSAKDIQPWRFVVVKKLDGKLAISGCGKFASHLKTAAVVVVIVQPTGARELDAGRCAQNMMLAARAEGIGSCPATMHDQECALRAVGVPAGYTIPVVIAFGYSLSSGQETQLPAGIRRRKRVPLSELIHHESW